MVLVCCALAATGLMIIGHDRLLRRNINRFLNVHQLFARIFYGHLDFTDLNNSVVFGILKISNRLLLLFLFLNAIFKLRSKNLARPLMRLV